MTSVEEIDLLKEEVMSSPVLLRVWAEFVNNDYIGAAHLGPQFEGTSAPADGLYCLGGGVAIRRNTNTSSS